MVIPLRSQARLRHSLLHWAYYGLFRALRAAFVRPRRTRRRGRLKRERASFHNSQWSSCIFVPACASLARYSGASDALWACPSPSTPSGLRRLRPVSRTARGEAPSQRARASCAPPPLPHPQFAMVAPLRSQARLRLSLAYWAYYGLLPPLAAAFVRPFLRKGRLSMEPFQRMA